MGPVSTAQFGSKNFIALWKYHDFSITQILREINLEGLEIPKNAIFPIIWALNFVHLVIFLLQKVENSVPLNVLKWLILHFKNLQV